MRALGAIYAKEIRAYFHSAVAYAILVGFLLLCGYFFYSSVAYYALASLQSMQNPMLAQLDPQQLIITPLLSNLSVLLLLVAPLLTMRLISEERKTGAIELLLSYPLGDASVVLGKFLAAWTMMAVILALSWVQWAILGWLMPVHWPALLVGYLGLFLLSGAFISLGLLASAATENQIVAAISGFAGLLLLWLLGWSASLAGPGLGPMLAALGLGGHFERFPQGVLDTGDVAYFLLFMGVFLFLAIRTLEIKRWKS